jgi:aspartate/methionine/tyrosine aminotransferase
VNRDLLSIRPHASKAISDAALANSDLVNLSIGEASFGAPQKVLDALTRALSEPSGDVSPAFNRYAHSRGTPALRQAIARRYRRLYGVDVDPEAELLVTHGAAEAIWLAVFSLTNPGDEVLIPDPCYVLYDGITLSLGRRAMRLATSAESGFRFTAQQFRDAITPSTRLVILNSPANPTGAFYEATELAALLAVAREAGVTVLHDEVFDRVVFDGAHTPLAALDPGFDSTIMVNSLSKVYGMTGWRLGWLVARPEVVEQALKAHTYMSLAVATVIQDAVTDALNDPEVDAEVERNITALQQRMLRVKRELESIDGVTFPAGAPRGGFYLFPRVTGLAQRLGLEGASASEAVTAYLARHGVAVVPGNVYGPSGEGHIRLVVAAPDALLDEALARMRRALAPIAEVRA